MSILETLQEPQSRNKLQQITLTTSYIRPLTDSEKQIIIAGGGPDYYKYVVVGDCQYINTLTNELIIVPHGFLTDGNSGGVDCGFSWLFHDYLYSTHKFSNERPCSREEADIILKKILKLERFRWLGWFVSKATYLNPFYIFSKAWNESGKRGPQLLQNFISDKDINTFLNDVETSLLEK